ncbi:deoxyribodipyrimidine photo-lyase [Vibrio salinus]|uniref:deoxyribodipyrimidine photo-lyase n=1 Tax=Vibrio salinus TaxID=2899784 RepID=UPI001E50E7FA|nr:deoxyribodipyrimidine photo-lyase [Vibrio salinus]MCE0495020.1 deoxyribodipyrimidine photo-lyase [Vibrio salinus]
MKLVWLRTDLRALDNTALNQALNGNDPVVALYIATPGQWHSHTKSRKQADLIYRRLFELQKELAALNVPLLYAEVDTYDDSITVLEDCLAEFGVKDLFFNYEYEMNERRRDEFIEGCLKTKSIRVHAFHDKCMYPPGTVLNKQNDYFKVFTPFKKSWLSRFQTPSVIQPSPASYRDLSSEQTSWLLSSASCFSYPRESSDDWTVNYRDIEHKLDVFCDGKLRDYHKKRDFPAVDGISRLSPYLAIGALSVRQCLARAGSFPKENLSDGAEVWISELIWREFYQHLMVFREDLCTGKDFHAWGKRIIWQYSPGHLKKWQSGETGYPIIDAAMRQLNQTGWMHNRLRMIVASFLIKDLHINWRAGETYFMEKLIDGDFPSNNGGWQWCASTGCDGQPYFRIFNPVSQSKKFDAEGLFIKRWIPELAHVPAQYIHEPWRWKGATNLSYPSPIVDHGEERKVTLELYRVAKDTCQ